MVDEVIINYFKKYKDRFPKEVLKEKLINAGYPEEEVKEGIEIVYGKKRNLRRLETTKLYITSAEKQLDFLIGFFAPGIVSTIFSLIVYYFLHLLGFSFRVYFHSFFAFLIPILTLGGHIFGIFYFWKRRRYLALGLLFALLFPFILLGLLILFFLLIIIF